MIEKTLPAKGSRSAGVALCKEVGEARDADGRINEFLGALSHEVRTPLSAMQNGAYVLDHAAPGSDLARQARGLISRQVEELTRLFDDLMDVTRIHRDRIELEMVRLDLRELIGKTIEAHRARFEEGQVNLEFAPALSSPRVNADPVRLAQVIGILLVNAIRFTGRGGSTTVSLSTLPADKLAVIRVADTGAGIERGALLQVFDPFAQAPTTTDPVRRGLRLGLALVKGLIELHGGDVRAASDGPGTGSEFIVRLPLAPRERTVSGVVRRAAREFMPRS